MWRPKYLYLDRTLFKDLVIQEEHFYQANHQLIFRAMKAVVDAEQYIDMVTVTTELGEAINQVGGTSYLLAIAQSIASTAPLKHHEQLIFNTYHSRKAREYALRFVEKPADQALEINKRFASLPGDRCGKLRKDCRWAFTGYYEGDVLSYTGAIRISNEVIFYVFTWYLQKG